MAADARPVAGVDAAVAAKPRQRRGAGRVGGPSDTAEAPPAVELRSDFSETAFWKPQLLTDADGSAVIEFKVPDSVTSWNVWVHAVTRDLKAGSVRKETQSVKDLMVRPYLPRFLREGDAAQLKVVVNNASAARDVGQARRSTSSTPRPTGACSREFGLTPEQARQPFAVAAGGGADVTFPLAAPRRVGSVRRSRSTATSGDFSDGELRPLPVLPGRMHLVAVALRRRCAGTRPARR